MKRIETNFGYIPCDWKLAKIGTMANTITDYVANGSFASLKENVRYLDEETDNVLIRLTDYNNDFTGPFVYVDDHAYEFLSKSRLFGGEIIISNVGANVGTVFRCPELNKKMTLGPNAIVLRFENKSCIDDFYYYWFLSPAGQFSLQSLVTGSAQPKFNKTSFRSMVIPIPPIEMQEKTSELLKTLDRKIAVNKQANDYLAELVRTEFDYRYGADVPTVDLGDVLTISTKSLKPSLCAGETWEHFSIPAFDEGRKPVFEPADGIKSNKYVIDNDCILISKLNPSTKRLWLPLCTSDRPVCSTEFIVYKPKARAHKSFYYAAVDSPRFTDFLLAHVTGSTGSRQRSQPKATLNYPMPFPGTEEIEEFCTYADPLIRQWQVNEQESVQLAQLRDALLPKLMSGEIDVSMVQLPTQPNNHLSGLSD